MFEVVATVCLLSAPATCRDMLLPGYEAATHAGCEARLSDVAIVPGDHLHMSETRCQAVGFVGTFDEIAPGVFAHLGAISDVAPGNYGDVSNTGFVIGEASVAIIDTGGSRKVAEDMYRAVRAQTDLPVGHVVLTHMHPDHGSGQVCLPRWGPES